MSRVTAELTTYRYLRLALLVLLAALAVSVGAETVRGGWETSISAYYYTAAGPVFVGVLTSIGVCLVSLRGHTDAEDVCLNLAGISAPMVAFVPTPEQGERPDHAAIVNNALTYLVVLALGYLVVVVHGLWSRRRHRPGWPSGWGTLGLLGVALAWLVGVAWIAWDSAHFARHAHLLAAAFTFAPFGCAVLLNTRWGRRVLARVPDGPVPLDRTYWAITLGLLAVAAAGLAVARWEYALLAVEVGLLLLFALFWVLQSLEELGASRGRGGAGGAVARQVV